jgi:hypothetical protein
MKEEGAEVMGQLSRISENSTVRQQAFHHLHFSSLRSAHEHRPTMALSALGSQKASLELIILMSFSLTSGPFGLSQELS